MKVRIAFFAVALLCLAPVAVAAAPAAPLPAQAKPASSHAPYEAGDCSLCHQGADPRQPGAVKGAVNDLCLGCHDEFVAVLKRANTHAPARASCTSCHNPHNAPRPKLLMTDTVALCAGCHDAVAKVAAQSKVPHRAVSTGAQCLNCHNPHGSAVQKLLVREPFDLCVACHDNGNMTGANGRKLQNVKQWLDDNKVWHGPVAAKDCSNCHEPHGSRNFRLLKEEYPPEFYAAYDARSYALCFSCHQEAAFSTPKTTTLTSFRNGDQNLHYVHLQQPGRGRTCRACHEVHASKQDHHIREGVPYGSSGWVLKLNYRKSANGGSCEKTCHQEKKYANVASR
ncbi:MAG: cytochrome c3 family protein [Betaproteobacteria bacterium]